MRFWYLTVICTWKKVSEYDQECRNHLLHTNVEETMKKKNPSHYIYTFVTHCLTGNLFKISIYFAMNGLLVLLSVQWKMNAANEKRSI